MKEYRRFTEKRKGKNVIPLLNMVCGVDLPRWCIAEESSIRSYLSGDAVDKLAELEDKIEQGLMLELPCKFGDKIYLVPSKTVFELNRISDSFSKHNRVYEMEVYQVYMNKNDYVLYNFEQTASALGSSFGETWFLTKAEAEQKLQNLKS